MNEEIEEILASVVDVDGVDGVLAIDLDGGVIGSVMPGVYDDELLGDAASSIVNVVSTIRELGIKPEDLAFDYPETTLVVRDLRHGHLVLLTQATISISLLNIATNVARKKLTKLLAPTQSATTRKRRKAPAARPSAEATAASGPASAAVSSVAATATANGSSPSSVFSGSSSVAFNSLAPAVVVFNQLLRAIIRRLNDENPSAIPPLLATIVESGEKQGLGAPAMAAIHDFAASSGATRIIAPLEVGQLSSLTHAAYVCLCEVLGPIMGDQVVSGALQATRNLPEAKDFSPYDLL